MDTHDHELYEGVEPEIAARIAALYKLAIDLRRACQTLDAVRTYAAVAVLISELDKMAKERVYNPFNTCGVLAMAKEDAAGLAGLTRSSRSLDDHYTRFISGIGKLASVLCFRRDS